MIRLLTQMNLAYLVADTRRFAFVEDGYIISITNRKVTLWHYITPRKYFK